MAAEEDSVARPGALGGGEGGSGGGGGTVDWFEPSLLSASSEGGDVWVSRGTAGVWSCRSCSLDVPLLVRVYLARCVRQEHRKLADRMQSTV